MSEIDEIPDLIQEAKPRRRIATRRKPPEEPEPESDSAEETEEREERAEALDDRRAVSLDDLDVAEMLPASPLKPVENVKSLGDLIAKYNIGQSTDFKLQVWRTYPKIFPGGIKADGFYDTWDQPLTEEIIQSEYGGGTYRVVVVGPHPSKPNVPKHYDSYSFQSPGEPKYDRQPRAIQGKAPPAADLSALPAPPSMAMAQENAKLSETAMKLAVGMAERERDERHRVEERALIGAQPAIEAERRRADDLVRLTNERASAERLWLQERLEESRAEHRRLSERLENMEISRPSVASELKELLPLTRPNGDGDKVAERMMESVLDKHRIEMESMRTQHQQLIENMAKQHEAALSSMRQAHSTESSALRESNQREISAERESGRRREERIEDQLRAEREERRRDQERHRETVEANDRVWKERIEATERSWKERLDMQVTATNTSWENRHQSVSSTFENRILWLQQENDRIKSELNDTKARMTDTSDPIAIVHKAKEIREAIGVPESSAPSGGGIGMGGGEDWKNMAVEGLTERAPQILQVLGSFFSGQQGQAGAQPQYQPGQVVQTPQGEMVVIQTPQGLAMTPRAALEQAQAQQQGRMLPQEQPQPRRRVMPDADEVAAPGRRRKRGPISATPNFADAGMYGSERLKTKRRPPWEGGGDDSDDEEPPQQQAPARQQAAPVPQQQQQAAPAAPRSSIERQGVNVVARMVHDAVMRADEPDEFAQKVLAEWKPETLKKVVGGYSPDEIARGVAEAHPNSAGASPAGQKFIREAFAEIASRLS